VLHHRDPAVVLGADGAFVHMLTSMTAPPASVRQPLTLWFRSTFGLRRIDGAWLIAHQHDSTPFYMRQLPRRRRATTQEHD
jgi:ketosteroid isomerase-like protein